MASCTNCGSSIPDGQGRSCSMCYGDIDYGRDGYYREWAERQGADDGQEDEQELAQPGDPPTTEGQ